MKHNRLITSLFVFSTSLVVNAQWRTGAIIGATYNLYSVETHYMSNWKFHPGLGGTIGIMGQYDFCDWFGLRTDLNWTQKDYWQKGENAINNYRVCIINHYIQFPIMGCFSLKMKSDNWKGFVNIGMTPAYWVTSQMNGYVMAFMGNKTESLEINRKKNDFNNVSDQRFELSMVGGMGIEKKFKNNWVWQIEARCYYGITSTKKNYMVVKEPRYNTTFVLQGTICRLL